MRHIKAHPKKLNDAKNLARGALASLQPAVKTLKRRGDVAPIERTSIWDVQQTRTHRLNKAIESARSGLTKADVEKFNKWLDSIIPSLDLDSGGLGVHLPSLGMLPQELLTSGLDKELEASIRRLKTCIPEIISFSKVAKRIAENVGRRQYSDALSTLEEVKNSEGYSFWYVESKLALTRLNCGVEKLKSEVEKLSIGGQGHQRFFFYYFGVRNEPAQSSLRFRSSVKKVIDDSKLSNSLKSYLKFRLYGWIEPRSDVLAEIIAYEQSTTLVDLFFTFTKVCNLVLSQSRHFSGRTVDLAKEGLTLLAEAIKSFALKTSGTEPKCDEISDLAFNVLNYFFQSPEQGSISCEDVQAVSAVAAQLSTRGNELQADEASKAFINMSWLPVANAIGEIQNIPTLPELVLFNDPAVLATPFLIGLHTKLTSKNTDPFSKDAVQALRKFWRIYELRNEQRIEELVEFLRVELKTGVGGDVEDALTILYADALFQTGELQECVSICAAAGQTNERLLPLLPFSDLFIGKRWVKVRTFGPSVELAIALTHACKVIDDEKLRTFKRFATEELLTKHSCLTIDELIPKLATDIDHEVVAYFGYNVCDIATIELLPGMGESRHVRRVRVSLLRHLAALHTNRAVLFETEAQSLEDALQVDDGLSVLDDSKVHVDEEAVVNYISTEYQADFQRYKKLVASGIGQAESLNDILKYIDTPSARIFQIPKNDADDLLVQLTNNILQRFLYDPASGLDIIIGRRIRHNTISSELRGVLEKDDLIGTIHHGIYQPAGTVMRACSQMNAKQKKIVFAANARFSESIDQLVAVLRDHYFNVKSRTKPRGVFELSINSVLIALVRSAAQTCTHLEQFTRECISSFWMFLSFKLEVTRPDIEAEILRILRLSFQKFSLELTTQGVDITVISTVQRAAEELERRAITIASWVGVPKLLLETQYHELRKTIDIAVAVVSGQVPGFKPIVEPCIKTDIALDSRGFAIVSDALYVAVDNVAQHSGKKMDNKISFLIDFDRERSLLTFDITSETAPSARKPDKLQRFQSIKADIQRKTFVDGARRNKHSGLYKLAALVHQSKNTNLSFDFIQKDKFNLQFELSYVPFVDSAVKE
ncbi:MAG: hypothetical protein Q7T66_10450 [Herminiimonas sp.]|uniref:hypothetical protein n=1 Tax=Herminiimonas sp. TaxID=1926289 RepID=UPI00271EC2C7|nr:hypothetical protein [Herminiimonas sp.]MDO9421073.1 hypothetical protein [Herminiimonas sp.]